ncbi:class I SAM-dependent methyltransferase [Dongshaea marina]|uniref:class I SAM-dependent methyltransferase n=1 Tax=Dongshaea marina TaxID=2047966 RepID=UPI000D3E6829|nr:class I SAM-dependent methyltransferase [Dongshaea marina]
MQQQSEPGLCPLCGSLEYAHYFTDSRRDYWLCEHCGLVFVAPQQYLSEAQERAEYDLHQNSPDDAGYRRFLGRVFDPICARISAGARGLDFGCGPGPTLSLMFEEAGYPVALYDHFYYPQPSALQAKYDFITATEVVEHLHQPMQVIKMLVNCLKPGGVLGVMTKLVKDRQAFANWHYKNDLTHVCFFSQQTFRWLAGELELQLEFIGSDVILLSQG